MFFNRPSLRLGLAVLTLALGACSVSDSAPEEEARAQAIAMRDRELALRERAAAEPQRKMVAAVVPPGPSPFYPGPQAEERDRFAPLLQNPLQRVVDAPVSTFSIDVDTASYSASRRWINYGRLPKPDMVRVEEWLNYFDYTYPVPENAGVPFNTQVTVTDSPWHEGSKLLHIGIKGYEITPEQRPKANLVFLVDVSGSMTAPDKLPLVTRALRMMLTEMNPDDRVALVVYAGASGVVLPPTEVREKTRILQALDSLQAGGGTAGAEGIELAYQLAREHFDKTAVNRVILATDGDFNLGVSDDASLKAMISRQREQGIYLSVLGVGQGNYNDQLMQTLAQNGNGVAAYIDTLSEARKVLVTEASASLFTIAEDVKIQVEFNPATVQEYRLIGYETRALEREDFNNDAVDAGEIGAGHTVTAIYEFTPAGTAPRIEPGRYEAAAGANVATASHGDECAFVKLRYKRPGEKQSQLLEVPVAAGNSTALSVTTQQDVDFAVAVAGAAEILRGGKYSGNWTLEDAITLAQQSKGDDEFGYRAGFIQMLRQASQNRKL
nr:VWA domain-containing protein [Pseudomaricurvus sp. HS19]